MVQHNSAPRTTQLVDYQAKKNSIPNQTLYCGGGTQSADAGEVHGAGVRPERLVGADGDGGVIFITFSLQRKNMLHRIFSGVILLQHIKGIL
jgi:hypothetical protein